MYKSTADHDSGKILYDRYSAVDDEFLALRKTVLARKTPRRMFVQAHTSLTGKRKITAFIAVDSAVKYSFVKRGGRVNTMQN